MYYFDCTEVAREPQHYPISHNLGLVHTDIDLGLEILRSEANSAIRGGWP